MRTELNKINVGDKGTIWFGGGNLGQGGTITSIYKHPDTNEMAVAILTPLGDYIDILDPEWFEREDDRQAVDDARLAGWDDYESDKPFDPGYDEDHLCEAYSHGWSEAVKYGNKNRDSIARYADSDVEPGWFDPSYAGERWEDD